MIRRTWIFPTAAQVRGSLESVADGMGDAYARLTEARRNQKQASPSDRRRMHEMSDPSPFNFVRQAMERTFPDPKRERTKEESSDE